jgi:hypothetical protein
MTAPHDLPWVRCTVLHSCAQLPPLLGILPHAFHQSYRCLHLYYHSKCSAVVWRLCLLLLCSLRAPAELRSKACCSVPAPAGCPAPCLHHSLQRSGCSQCATGCYSSAAFLPLLSYDLKPAVQFLPLLGVLPHAFTTACSAVAVASVPSASVLQDGSAAGPGCCGAGCLQEQHKQQHIARVARGPEPL